MAIYTRFGSPVPSIEWFDDENGEVGCIIETEGRNPRARVVHSSHLRADGGIKEIWDAAKVIRNPRNPGTDPREA